MVRALNGRSFGRAEVISEYLQQIVHVLSRVPPPAMKLDFGAVARRLHASPSLEASTPVPVSVFELAETPKPPHSREEAQSKGRPCCLSPSPAACRSPAAGEWCLARRSRRSAIKPPAREPA